MLTLLAFVSLLFFFNFSLCVNCVNAESTVESSRMHLRKIVSRSPAKGPHKKTRRIHPLGIVTTLVGETKGADPTGTYAGNAANVDWPNRKNIRLGGLEVDSSGEFIYTVDKGGIRKISLDSGLVTTYAGGSIDSTGHADGALDDALFSSPSDLKFNRDMSSIYVADSTNTTIIRVISVGSGIVTTLNIEENFGVASYLAVGVENNKDVIYFTTHDIARFNDDYNGLGSVIFRVYPESGVVSAFAGRLHQQGFMNGNALTEALLCVPQGLAIAADGSLFFCDTYNHAIRKVSSNVVMTFVGNPTGTSGWKDGVGTTALFQYPYGLAIDSTTQYLYVADTGNNAIRAVAPDGQVWTICGGGYASYKDDIGGLAGMVFPTRVAVLSSNQIFMSDNYNGAIRRIRILPGNYMKFLSENPSALVTTKIRGGPNIAYIFDFAEDSAGNFIITDMYSHNLKKITPTGETTLFAGSKNGESGTTDETGGALFIYPYRLTTDSTGNLFVSEMFRIRKITAAGVITVFAGDVYPGYQDGEGVTAIFSRLFSLTIDSNDNLYVADSGNNAIRKIDPLGMVSTYFTGNWDGKLNVVHVDKTHDLLYGVFAQSFFYLNMSNIVLRSTMIIGGEIYAAKDFGVTIDGRANGASFKTIGSITTDEDGNIYVTDYDDDVVRVIEFGTFNVKTLAGYTSLISGSSDGRGWDAHFYMPSGIHVSTSGELLVADSLSRAIRKIQVFPTQKPTTETTRSPTPKPTQASVSAFKPTPAPVSSSFSPFAVNPSFVPVSIQ